MRIPATLALVVIMGLAVGCGTDDGSPENIERADSAAALAGGMSCRPDSDGVYDCGSVTCYVTRGRTSPDGNGTSDYYDCVWRDDPDSATGASEWVCVVDTDGVMTEKDTEAASCVP